jgi:hypothetical protein
MLHSLVYISKLFKPNSTERVTSQVKDEPSTLVLRLYQHKPVEKRQPNRGCYERKKPKNRRKISKKSKTQRWRCMLDGPGKVRKG